MGKDSHNTSSSCFGDYGVLGFDGKNGKMGMAKLISILRSCLFLIEVFAYNPPPTIHENQSENLPKEPDFLWSKKYVLNCISTYLGASKTSCFQNGKNRKKHFEKSTYSIAKEPIISYTGPLWKIWNANRKRSCSPSLQKLSGWGHEDEQIESFTWASTWNDPKQLS